VSPGINFEECYFSYIGANWVNFLFQFLMLKCPIGLMKIIVSHLELDDTLNVIYTCKSQRKTFGILERIIRGIKTKSIYLDPDLLEIAYNDYTCLLIDWKTISLDNLITFNNRIFKFHNWEELKEIIGYLDSHNFIGVCSYLYSNPNLERENALICSSCFGSNEITIQLLQDPRLDPSIEENRAIRLASENGHLEIVRILLADLRIDPSVYDNYALLTACTNGFWKIAELLLKDSRVDPSNHSNQCIYMASRNGHTEVVRSLLDDSRVDPADLNNRAIRIAAQNRHVDIVQLLSKNPRVSTFNLDHHSAM
jgi:hypothetical protein